MESIEFCVWCKQPVYSSPRGHGNGKMLYLREGRGFKEIGAVHYYCIGKFQKMRSELMSKHNAMIEAANSSAILASSEPQESIAST